MADCKCGATVTYVFPEGDDSGDLIPLEAFMTTEGPRWGVRDYAQTPWTAFPLDPTSNASGHPDHRGSCPFRQT